MRDPSYYEKSKREREVDAVLKQQEKKLTKRVKKTSWQHCLTCKHPKREKIDEALIGGKYTMSEISAKYGISANALFNHKVNHLFPLMQKVVEKKNESALKQVEVTVDKIVEAETRHGEKLVDKVWLLYDRANAILKKAEKRDNPVPALQAIREVRETLKLIAAMLGELKTGDTNVNINILGNPTWIGIKEATIQVLAEYDGAPERLLNKLSLIEGEVVRDE